jgi:kynureninase
MTGLDDVLDEARALDEADPLRGWRDEFAHPRHPDSGDEVAYLCGHSLGLQPRPARAAVERVLDHWATLGVDGHFSGPEPWYRFDEPPAAHLEPVVGARPGEVAVAGTLTVDLHLLLASFYRPTPARRRVLVEATAFPSDRYAVDAQVAWHGFDPADAVVAVDDDEPGATTQRVLDVLAARGDEIALVLLGGVNYRSGELLDIERITAAARAAGCVVGWDLAHAAGNVPLQLHDWDVDFAAWCTYKYLNGGPGSVGAYFVHARHDDDPSFVRLAGWWGNEPDRRFAMDQERAFTPRRGAAGWKVSNPPVLALAAVRAALESFDAVGIDALRAKSVALTTSFAGWLRTIPGVRILTPDDPQARGAMLTLHLPGRASAVHEALGAAGVVGDLRAPDTIRLTPVPLYCGWEDAARAALALRHALAGS